MTCAAFKVKTMECLPKELQKGLSAGCSELNRRVLAPKRPPGRGKLAFLGEPALQERQLVCFRRALLREQDVGATLGLLAKS